MLSSSGVNPGALPICQREVVLSNRLSLLLMPFVIVGIIIGVLDKSTFTIFVLSSFLVFLFSVFLLNENGKTVLARFGLSILPQFFLLPLIVIFGIESDENYRIFSYSFIGLTIIPLLLFRQKKNQGLLSFILVFNFSIVLLFDLLLPGIDRNIIFLQLVEDNYIYNKLPQVILWFLMVSGFQFLKRENLSYEEKLKSSTNSLVKSNNEKEAQSAEIAAQNIIIHNKQLIIDEQIQKLKKGDNELKNTKLEFLKTIENLKKVRNMLRQKEAETKSILNALNEHYLVAQYDLNGDLVSINTKVIELLGVVQEARFKNIKPIINQTNSKQQKALNGHYFNHIWGKIVNGESQTINLDFKIGEKTTYLATTFAPLFDLNNKPDKVLAIGQDITELVNKSESIDTINEELKELIFEVRQQNELLNFQQKEIYDKSEELSKQKEEIQTINESLELRVQERTSILEAKNKQLTEYAFINSHVLRSPISTMLGLINLIDYSAIPKEDQKIYEHIKETGKILDNVVFKINNAISNGLHFDRKYIDPKRNIHTTNKP